MKNFVTITDNGRFELNGKRWMCNSVVYFCHYPGAMLLNPSDDTNWSRNEAMLDQDFGAMLDYARTKGWIDEDAGAIVAHLEKS